MIIRRLVAALGAAVVATIALSGCGDTTPSLAELGCRTASDCVVVRLGETIPLGALVDESDAIGTDTQRSARLAIDYLDGSFDGTDGLLLGHPVALAVEPEFCTPEGGVAGAKRLLLDPNLVAVLGTTCSGAAYQAAATVLSQAKVLMVSPSNTSPKLTDPTEHERFYFRTSFNDLVQGAVVADFARDRLRATRAATVFTGDAYSKTLAETFTRAFTSAGGRLAAARQVSASGSVESTVQALAAAKPSVIFLPMFEPPCSRFVRAIRTAPALRRVPIIVSEACQSRAVLKALGSAGTGVFASGPDYGDLRVNRFYA
jgi:branched-chain amino acid transport system substrate-binding protein